MSPAAEGRRPVLPRADPRRAGPSAGRPGPARRRRAVPPRPVRPGALRAGRADRPGAPLARRRSTRPCSSTSSRRPRSWSGRPSWSSTASTLAFRTAPASSCSSSATDRPRPARSAEAKLFETGPRRRPGAGRCPDQQGRRDRLPRRAAAAQAREGRAVSTTTVSVADEIDHAHPRTRRGLHLCPSSCPHADGRRAGAGPRVGWYCAGSMSSKRPWPRSGGLAARSVTTSDGAAPAEYHPPPGSWPAPQWLADLVPVTMSPMSSMLTCRRWASTARIRQRRDADPGGAPRHLNNLDLDETAITDAGLRISRA